MIKVPENKMNKYYIAFGFKSDIVGFGDAIITNRNKLKMDTVRDIETIKNFILAKLKEDNKTIENVTIMDFRELEE